MSMLEPWGEENHSMSLVEIQEHRRTLKEKYDTFDLTRPVTDEEFDLALDWVFNFLLFDVKAWQTEFIKNPTLRKEIPILDNFPLLCRGPGILNEEEEAEEVEDEDEREDWHYLSPEEIDELMEIGQIPHQQKKKKKWDDEPSGKWKKPPCRYCEVCPIMKKLPPEEQLKLIGTPCRVDRFEGVRNFTAQAKELGLTPSDMSSMIQVAQIVRLLVMQRRIDWELAINDIMYEEISGANPVTGQMIYEKRTNQLNKESRAIETQISKHQSQLLATRKDRAAASAAFGRPDNALRDILLSARVLSPDGQTPPMPEDESIEAEFNDPDLDA